MSETTLNWRLVDSIAAELGAKPEARAKWRQRHVPPEWRIKITQTLMSRGVPISLSDFAELPKNPGRIAA